MSALARASATIFTLRVIPTHCKILRSRFIHSLSGKGATVYAPVKNAGKEVAVGKDPYRAKPKDAERVARWRERMGTEAAKEIYKRRASNAEWANTRLRSMGLRQFAVRGLEKAKVQSLLCALAHNLRQTRLLLERSKG